MQIGFKQGFQPLKLGIVYDADVFDVVPDFRQRVDVLLQGAVQPAPVLFCRVETGKRIDDLARCLVVIHLRGK